MVPFAGWEMPVQYAGVIPEHRAVRSDAGVFDVSHMGEIEVEGPKALEFLSRCSRTTLDRIEAGKAQYTLLTNERGGIVDDLIVYALDAVPVPARSSTRRTAGRLRVAQGARDPRFRGQRRLGRVRAARRPGAERVRAARAAAGAARSRSTGGDRRRRGDGQPHRLHRRGGCELLCMADDAGSSGTRCSSAASSRAGSARGTRCASRSATRSTATTSRPETDAISAGLGWTCALDKDFTGADELRADQGGRARTRSSSLRDGGARRSRARACRSRAAAGSRPARTRRCSTSASAWATCRPGRRARHRAHDRRARPAAPRARSSPSRSTSERRRVVAAAETLPGRPALPPRARLGAHRGRRGDARDHLVRAGRPRRARPLRGAGGRRARREGRLLRRGRVGEGGVGRHLAALGRGRRGQPEGRRRARDGERGSLRRGLARAHPARPTPPRPTPCWTPAAYRQHVAEQYRVAHPYLSLTDADREEMLAAIGVASVEELFRDIPHGVRFDRELDLEPALTEPELVAHLERARGAQRAHGRRALVPRRRDLRPLRSRGRRRGPRARRVPDRVHALPAGDEPGRPAGDLRVPDGDLRADGDGRLERVRLRRHDGRGGRLLRREARDRALEGRRRRGDQPAGAPGREDVRARLRARGRRGAAPGRARPTRTSSRAAADGAALRPLPAARTSSAASSRRPTSPPRPRRRRRARGRARRPRVARRARGARASTGARSRSARARAPATTSRYGGPHYGFLAARRSSSAGCPGASSARPTDAEGRRGYVLTLQTREQHIRREKATSNITTNQTLLALAGLVHLSWLGPQGLREVGETCLALAAYAKERLPLAFPERMLVQGARRPRRPPRPRGIRERARARHPSRLRARPRLRGDGRRARS